MSEPTATHGSSERGSAPATAAKTPQEVWVVTDEHYSGCDSFECSCSGILAQIFSTEQTAKQYAERQGGMVSRRQVLTALPQWVRR